MLRYYTGAFERATRGAQNIPGDHKCITPEPRLPAWDVLTLPALGGEVLHAVMTSSPNMAPQTNTYKCFPVLFSLKTLISPRCATITTKAFISSSVEWSSSVRTASEMCQENQRMPPCCEWDVTIARMRLSGSSTKVSDRGFWVVWAHGTSWVTLKGSPGRI